MTEQLKQAAQQATRHTPVLSDDEVRHCATCCVTTEDAIRAAEQKVLERALTTSQPGAQATPEPSRGMIGMGTQALAGELADALNKDTQSENSLGMLGANTMAWLRKVAAEYLSKPATPQQAAGEPVGELVAVLPDEVGFHVRWLPNTGPVLKVGDRIFAHPAPAVPEDVRTALEFYAGGNHFVRADADAWETVSGEPPNFWEDEANTATVEDGTIARNALAALAAAQAKGGEHG